MLRDAILAVLVAVHWVAVLGHRLPFTGTVLVLAGSLCLTWRRRAPMTVLVLTGTLFIAYEALGFSAPPLPFAPLIAIYTVATAYPAPISVSAAGGLAVAVVATAVARQSTGVDDQFLDHLVAVVTAWSLGYGVRLSGARAELLEEHARQLEREQETMARLAVEQEQARIARELHDIVAHNVSVIVAQAGASRRVFDTQPQHAQQALGSIESIGRETLTEMRRLLSVVCTDADRTPQPDLSQLPALVAQMDAAGLPTQLTITGTPRPLPAGVELNAYRIVQEALTNSLKHAGPARADVVLGYHPEHIELRVRDDGQGCRADAPPGHGLVGMHQRAALLGGDVVAGPGPGGGFRVMARLSVDADARRQPSVRRERAARTRHRRYGALPDVVAR